MTRETAIKLFESKRIRSVWNEKDQKWYFSVADVIEALTESVNVREYIKKCANATPCSMPTGGHFVPLLSCLP